MQGFPGSARVCPSKMSGVVFEDRPGTRQSYCVAVCRGSGERQQSDIKEHRRSPEDKAGDDDREEQ